MTFAGRMAAITDDICCLRFTLAVGAAILAAAFRVTPATRMSAFRWFVHRILLPRLGPGIRVAFR